MNITKEIRENAKKINATIILPEANLDARVKEAAEYILENKISNLIIFGKKSDFSTKITEDSNCKIIDIETYENIDDFTTQLYELRKHKGLTQEQAQELVKQGSSDFSEASILLEQVNSLK